MQAILRLFMTMISKGGTLRRVAPSASANARISPGLLCRAREAHAEFQRLAVKLESSFEASAAKRHGELSPIASAVKDYDRASESLSELGALLNDGDTDEELRKLAQEDVAGAKSRMDEAFQTLTTALIPKHPFAHLPCLIEIRPGVGGSEAALFAGDLLRMYQAFCSRKGLRCALLKYEDQEGVSDPTGSNAPLQEAILEVTSPGSYEMLRSEAGVHRVQRVPATESKGRTHTSAANVLVLPSLPTEDTDTSDLNNPNSDYFVSSADVHVDVMRSGGAGGQHVNKTESAVRLTHKPTNTVVVCEEGRSQLSNRQKAWQILRARLAQRKREQREEEMLKFRRGTSGHGKFGRGDKIRTYNWGQQRVTDHRSGLNINQLDDVVEGGEALDTVIDSVKAWMLEQEIEGLLTETEGQERH
ncbi:MAG: hypothetical protein Q9162_004607 [Coniocarpon cinnabarinum]